MPNSNIDDDTPDDVGSAGERPGAESSDGTPVDPITDHPMAEDDGPGCMPGILAATLIMGMLFFVTCGFLAWVIYGKRTELAIRTLETSYVELIEQSRLNPNDKQELLEEIKGLASELKSGKYEDWQASGALTRLARLPITRWGDLQAVETFAVSQGGELADDAPLHLSRLRRGVERNEFTTYDIEDVLNPVTVTDDEAMTRGLAETLRIEDVRDVILRAKLLADQRKIPERVYKDVRIRTIVRREIEAGLKDGTY